VVIIGHWKILFKDKGLREQPLVKDRIGEPHKKQAEQAATSPNGELSHQKDRHPITEEEEYDDPRVHETCGRCAAGEQFGQNSGKD
jgi:hypothetical protein